MADHWKQAIADLQAELKADEQAMLEKKRLVNSMCKRASMPPLYSDAQLFATSGPSLSIRSDQFYGRPLAGCIRDVLEMRRGLNQGPATVNELYEALQEGGFKFETKNEDNAKRGLRISLMKNSVTFHKLPNGKFGLLEWYPNAKATKPGKDNDEAEEAETESAESEDKP